jgi:hypothetical protein
VSSATSASKNLNTAGALPLAANIARSACVASMLTASSEGSIAASGGNSSYSRLARRFSSHSQAPSIHANKPGAILRNAASRVDQRVELDVGEARQRFLDTGQVGWHF